MLAVFTNGLGEVLPTSKSINADSNGHIAAESNSAHTAVTRSSLRAFGRGARDSPGLWFCRDSIVSVKSAQASPANVIAHRLCQPLFSLAVQFRNEEIGEFSSLRGIGNAFYFRGFKIRRGLIQGGNRKS